MNVRHEDRRLERLETDPEYTNGLEKALIKAFRMRMQMIRAAADERDFYALKSLHFEKLSGGRAGQYSMRLNLQWRLVMRLETLETGKTVVIIEIVDYH